jgi:hypothetical protein
MAHRRSQTLRYLELSETISGQDSGESLIKQGAEGAR